MTDSLAEAEPNVVRIGTSDIVVDLAPLGARVHRFWARTRSGEWRNLVLSMPNDDDYLASSGFVGATIGRVANRIRGGLFEINGQQYVLPRNDGSSTLHGGPEGFDRRHWQVAGATDRSVELALTSPHGDQGFPGKVDVRATFTVEGNRLSIGYRATTDRPTLVSLTSHPYFRLADDPEQVWLRVAADQWLPTNDKVPTGEQAAVQGTAFDLRADRSLGALVRESGGVDHTYVVDGPAHRPVAWLRGPELEVCIGTDQPGLHVYTAHDLQSQHHAPMSGVALEPGLFPNAVHQPEWISPLLLPGKTYVWNAWMSVGLAPQRTS